MFDNDTETYKGEIVKKQYLRMLVALVGFAGFAITAHGQTPALDQLVVKIPFEFVAAGKTLPAGEYQVRRLSHDPGFLLLTNYENRANAIVLPVESEESHRGKAQLSFETANDQRFLSQIDTEYRVYNLQVPRAETQLAATPHKGISGSASPGSN